MTDVDIQSEPAEVDPDVTVDNRGTGCANGIVRVQRALTDLDDGDVLRIQSTDKRAKIEYPRLTDQTSHELLAITSERTGLFRTTYTTYVRIRHE
jgi:TusA-related sulfurtransferase